MSARFTVERIAGDLELSDAEVFEALEKQFVITGCEMKISVKATEPQVDKAMLVLMNRVAKYETRRIKKGLPLA